MRHRTHHRLPALAAAAALAAVALATAVPGAAAAGDGELLPLPLEQAIAMALERNEGILIERIAADSAGAAVAGARGAYDPLLVVDSGWQRTTAPVNSAFSGAPEGELAPTDETVSALAEVSRLLPTGGSLSARAGAARGTSDGAFQFLSPAYDSRLGLELRQPLLRDRSVDAARLGLRVAAADRERALSSLGQEVLATVAEVERAYWELTAARLEIEVREEAVALADEQLSETTARIEEGASPQTEIAQPRAELERRRGELLQAREAVARAENRLKLLILGDGDDWSLRLAPSDEPAVEVVPVDAAAAMAAALAARPEVAAAEALVERRRAESAFARDRLRPALDLVVSYDRFGLAGARNPAAGDVPGLPGEAPPGLEGGFGDSLDSLAGGDFDDARIALVLELPLGNRQARAGAAIAGDDQRRAEAEVARARKAIRAEVLDATVTLDTVGGRIDAARAARRAAEVQLGAERDRYAVGLSTNFLVLTRQNDLAAARLAEIAALTDYRTARTELARATGSLLGERGIELRPTNPQELLER